MVYQLGKARQALDVSHGKAVGHACGVHGFGAGIGQEAALFIKVTEAFRQSGGFSERQQAQAFGGQPLLMRGGVQPAAEGGLEGVHGVPFLLL